ncbi:hypothetical protein A8F94_07155 [Bacillus sp. FJAT-27225]|uniref:hypothetical protein n=1 Tax=Bacillus sp. FJAT-27225 TaxID=1743144 RepID=UPI00080C2240|nr:hypothetical protein [Bacillus sp. FJAT-27225]OCA87628.1 hypothetical protein A8F94_07155 [Bacillus sp. FJAT-27225]
MIAEIQRFTNSYNKKKQISGLFRTNRLLVVDFGEWLMQISAESAALLEDIPNGDADYISIKGSREALKELVGGRERLRALAALGVLEVTGSFRSVLLLEAIFLLAKENHFEDKVNLFIDERNSVR